MYETGSVDGLGGFEVVLTHDGAQLGRLVLGGRRGDLAYTERDRAAVRKAADAVAEALAVTAADDRPPIRSRP